MSQSFIILIYIILLLMQKKMLIQFFKKLSSDSSAMGSLLKDLAVFVDGYLLGKSKIIFICFSSIISALLLVLCPMLFSLLFSPLYFLYFIYRQYYWRRYCGISLLY